MMVAFTDHSLCLASLPLGAIFRKRTVIVAFTDLSLCSASLPVGTNFWIDNCDSGIPITFTLIWLHVNHNNGIY